MYHYCISQTWSKSYVLAFILTKYKKNLANTSLLIESQHIKTVIWSKIYSDWKAQTWNHRRTQVTEMPTKCMYAILIDSWKEEKKMGGQNLPSNQNTEKMLMGWNILRQCGHFTLLFGIRYGPKLFAVIVWCRLTKLEKL